MQETTMQNHVPDSVYQLVRRHFCEKEMVDLTAATDRRDQHLNKITIAFRSQPQVQTAKIAT
jgi:hypothetical protein